MKLLVVGAFSFPIYEEAFVRAWNQCGYSAESFSFEPFFRGILGKAEWKYSISGPCTFLANAELKSAVVTSMPEIVLVWRGTTILPSTYRFIREKCQTTIVSYNNDDPFNNSNAMWHHRMLWRRYIKSLPLVDLALFYRKINIAEGLSLGAKRADVMLPYFIPEKDHPIQLSEEDRLNFECDVVFTGHYEPDGREDYLKALVRAGLKVRLFGGKKWSPSVLGDYADYFSPVRQANGEEYIKSLCGAQMCLCFLSRLNRDTYTRRCFEIPACGSLLLSERTADLQELFREDEEAVFFSSVEELVEKALWLKANPQTVDRIAEAGHRRVHAGGHSVVDRARQFHQCVRRISRSLCDGN
ncbi:CgeB family protein [Novipirellula sp. SH528]|uniref:CgeB family protein n=1 Tax=Novipirellula sp. SH528 TaxID=3454466 RepID=UPI003FA0BCF6